MRIATIVLLVLAGSMGLQACPKGGDSGKSGDQEPVVEVPQSRFSGHTKEFVDRLVGSPALVWAVEDSGVAVVYDKLFFAEDGTFRAEATVRFSASDTEPFSCAEEGTWALDDDKAQSSTVGLIDFHMAQTDCAGRTAPMDWRALTTINGDAVDFEDR